MRSKGVRCRVNETAGGVPEYVSSRSVPGHLGDHERRRLPACDLEVELEPRDRPLGDDDRLRAGAGGVDLPPERLQACAPRGGAGALPAARAERFGLEAQVADEVRGDLPCRRLVELRLHALRREHGHGRQSRGRRDRFTRAGSLGPRRQAGKDERGGEHDGRSDGRVRRVPAAAATAARPELRREQLHERAARHRRAVSERSSVTFVQNSVDIGAIRSTASSATRRRRRGARGARDGVVFGSVIMKKRKIITSGERTSTRQKSKPVIGPRCQRAVISWPLAAITAIPAAKVIQKMIAITSRCTRDEDHERADEDDRERERHPGRHRPPPEVERIRASRAEDRKQSDEPEVRRVEEVAPRNRITCFDRSATAAVAAKIHQPCRLHQSPCCVPGTRRTKATPLPVSSALAGHMITRWR